MTAGQLAQHLVDTAPTGAPVLVRTAGGVEVDVAHAHVETRDGHVAPVVIVYLKAAAGTRRLTCTTKGPVAG